MNSHLPVRAQKLIESAFEAAYVLLAILYMMYVIFKFGNMQTDGLFQSIGALIAVNVAYINLLFNRARATEVARIKRRTIAAAEIALRGFVSLLISTLIITIIYFLATAVFDLRPATHPAKSLVPTYPILAVVTLIMTFGVVVSLLLTLSSIEVLLRRDFGRVVAQKCR